MSIEEKAFIQAQRLLFKARSVLSTNDKAQFKLMSEINKFLAVEQKKRGGILRGSKRGKE